MVDTKTCPSVCKNHRKIAHYAWHAKIMIVTYDDPKALLNKRLESNYNFFGVKKTSICYVIMVQMIKTCPVMNYNVLLNYLLLPDEKRKLNNRDY